MEGFPGLRIAAFSKWGQRLLTYDVIHAVERRTIEVAPSVYRWLEDDPAFWRLVEDGIVQLQRDRRIRYGIKAGAFVGQALVGHYCIYVSEKIQGALASLLSIAQVPDARLTNLPAFAAPGGQVLSALIDRYLDLLDAYLQSGRQKKYVTVMESGGMPRGKLRVSKTLALWAKGNRSSVAYTRERMSPSVFPNQILGLSLSLLDHILGDDPVHIDRRRRVRTAAILFEDTEWFSISRLSAEEFQQRYSIIDPRNEGEAALFALARLFDLHFGITTVLSEQLLPFAWFVNLATLFEDAARYAVSTAATDVGYHASGWQHELKFVFADAKLFRTKPDIVLWRGKEVIGIADVKYKDYAGSPDEDDVYQLTAHATAWGAKRAALIYPAEEFSEQHVGEDANGVRISAFTFNLRDMTGSSRMMLARAMPEMDQHHPLEAALA